MNLTQNEFDGINFFRHDEQSVKIEGFTLENIGEKKEGSVMGDWYDIIILADIHKKQFLPERFEAILTSPLDYVERMIDNGFQGVVLRSTNKSNEYMNEVYKHLTNAVSEIMKNNEEKENDE